MKVLYLTHNTPFPPNKGEKIRSFHLLQQLSKEHEVHLVSLAKDPADVKYRNDLLEWCSSCCIVPLHPWLTRFAALASIFSPFPLTFGYFFSLKFRREVSKLTLEHSFDLIFAVCSSAAQYVFSLSGSRIGVDFVDVDSEKWRQYSEVSKFPRSWIYALEHRRLRKWEGRIFSHADFSLVTTEIEKNRLEQIVTDTGDKLKVLSQGVNTDYFKREQSIAFEKRIVFVGQMDYLPNIDAVIYFYLNVLPLVKAKVPNAQFWIIGRNPSERLREVCADAIVTGEVEDVRETLHPGRVMVAPLRLVFGMQSKVLEAMASGIPVVTTSKVATTLRARQGDDLYVSDSAVGFANLVTRLLEDDEEAQRVGANGQKYVTKFHSWSTLLEQFSGMIRGAETESVEVNRQFSE